MEKMTDKKLEKKFWELNFKVRYPKDELSNGETAGVFAAAAIAGAAIGVVPITVPAVANFDERVERTYDRERVNTENDFREDLIRFTVSENGELNFSEIDRRVEEHLLVTSHRRREEAVSTRRDETVAMSLLGGIVGLFLGAAVIGLLSRAMIERILKNKIKKIEKEKIKFEDEIKKRKLNESIEIV